MLYQGVDKLQRQRTGLRWLVGKQDDEATQVRCQVRRDGFLVKVKQTGKGDAKDRRELCHESDRRSCLATLDPADGLEGQPGPLRQTCLRQARAAPHLPHTPPQQLLDRLAGHLTSEPVIAHRPRELQDPGFVLRYGI